MLFKQGGFTIRRASLGARVTNNLTCQSREAFGILEGVFSDLAAVECVVEVLKVSDKIYSHLGCILLLG